MRKTKPSLEIGIISKSNSKSQSKDKTLEKVYTSPPKCKKKAEPVPQVDLKRTKASSRPQKQYSSSKNQCSSASKSKFKNKTIRYKISDSPYQKTDKKSVKKLIKFSDTAHNFKTDLEKCKAKIDAHRYEQAKKYLQKLNKQHPENHQIIYLLGFVADQENNDQEAKKNYRAYLKMISKDHESAKKLMNERIDLDKLQKLAKANFYLHNFENTIEYCSRLLNHKKQQKIYELKGLAQLARKKYGPAIDSFSNAISLNKDNPQLYEYQGDCYKGIQAYELALNCYSKFNQNLSSDCLRILEKKVQCFRLLGNHKKQEQLGLKIEKLRTEMSNQVVGVKIHPTIKKNTEESEKIQTNSQNFDSILPMLRPSTPTLSMVEQEYNNGNIETSLAIINKIVETQGENLKNLYWTALLLYGAHDYQGCQKMINKSIKLLENPALSLVTFLVPDSQQTTMLSSLKFISNKLKELNAYTLTQEEQKFITDRRKKCLQEALNVFKGKENPQIYDSGLLSSKLTMIMEESSLKSSRLYENDQSQSNSIFILRSIRKVIKNWHENKFSLKSLEETTDLAYSLVKIRYKQFSILPMHIIYYTLRPENWNKKFTQINEEINVVLSKMSQKYPPSQGNISNSELRRFGVKWEEKEPINLLHSVFKGQVPKFASYKQLHKAIELIADKAQQQMFKMNEICKKICLENNNGFGYKIGLKVDKNSAEIVEQRVLSRIIQKMLMKEIKEKKNSFFNDIPVKPNKKLSEYFSDIEKQWEETIEDIISDKNKKNQQIKCYVYDFLRAKCMFFSTKDMRDTALQFIDMHSKGEIYILEIDDRLSTKTRDVVLKFKIKDIVGELQLALQFQSIQNQFNHGLYELFRSPFGPFFASVMWFSGFALKKNQIFFKEKIKWGLHGLEHLRKFIYEDEIPISLINQSEKISYDLILTDFDMSAASICANLCTTKHLYLAYDENQSKIITRIEKPQMKFIIKLRKGSFIAIEEQKYEISLLLEGTQIYLALAQENKLTPMMMENSISAQTLIMKIKSRTNRNRIENPGTKEDSKYYNYTHQIQQCKKMQLSLIELLNKMSSD